MHTPTSYPYGNSGKVCLLRDNIPAVEDNLNAELKICGLTAVRRDESIMVVVLVQELWR